MAGRHPAASPERFRWAQLVQVPRCVWLVTIAFLFLLLSATVLYPPYRGPDEPLHVDLVLALDQGVSPLWEPASRDTSDGVRAGALLPNTRLGAPQMMADASFPDRPERVSYNDLGGDASSGSTNQLVQHPPAYYLMLSGVLALVPGWEDMPFDRVVTVLRLVTVLLIAPLPLLAYSCARRLTRSAAVPVIAAVMVAGVPQLVHIGSAVNNDNLLNLLAGLCTVLVAFVCTGDLSRRTAVSAGVVLGLGLQTKGLMLVFVGVLGLAYLVAWGRMRTRSAVTSGALALTVAFLIGGWWWLRNLLVFGRVQPAGRLRADEVVRGWGDEAWRWLSEFAFFVNLRYWFDHPSGSSTGISVGLAVLATTVAAALVVVALWPRPGREAPVVVLAVLALPVPALLAVLVAGSYESFTFGVNQPAFQGRYLFGGLVGISSVAALGLARWLDGAQAAAVAAPVLGWCVAVQALAAFTASRLYWWPGDGGILAMLDGMVRVMPWPDGLVPLVFAATVVAAAAAFVDVLRYRRAAPARPSDRDVGLSAHLR